MTEDFFFCVGVKNRSQICFVGLVGVSAVDCEGKHGICAYDEFCQLKALHVFLKNISYSLKEVQTIIYVEKMKHFRAVQEFPFM